MRSEHPPRSRRPSSPHVAGDRHDHDRNVQLHRAQLGGRGAPPVRSAPARGGAQDHQCRLVPVPRLPLQGEHFSIVVCKVSAPPYLSVAFVR